MPISFNIPPRLQKAKGAPNLLAGTNHWSKQLKPGQTKIIDGIIVSKPGENIGQSRQIKTCFAGVPQDEQPTFDIEPIDFVDTASLQKMQTQQKSLAKWYAQYRGKFLSGQQKAEYEKLCMKSQKDAQEALKPVLTEIENDQPISSNLTDIRAQLAEIMATYLIEEQKLFQNNVPAQKRRYGKTLMQTNLQKPLLKDALVNFLSNPHVNAPAVRAKDIRPKFPIDYKSAMPGLFAGPIEFAEVKPNIHDGKVQETKVTYEGYPLIAAVEAVAYVFKHVAVDFPDDIEQYFGSDPQHTSIVAGIWTIEQQKKITEIIERDVNPPSPFNRSAFAKWLAGTVISKKVEICTQKRLFNWDLANGCAGTYNPNDTVQVFAIMHYPVETSFPNALAKARKWIFGVTPNKNWRIKACSYPMGNYGICWVCHQCANAFSYRKWGYYPVHEFTELFFGLDGVMGISEHICQHPDLGGPIHVGGVPGNECFYNVWPPHAEPISGHIVDDLMDGHGWGLDKYWDGKKWSDTNAGYTRKEVPILESSWDEPIECTPA